jgi:hypothetical protein
LKSSNKVANTKGEILLAITLHIPQIEHKKNYKVINSQALSALVEKPFEIS